jgi:hypothetical protein
MRERRPHDKSMNHEAGGRLARFSRETLMAPKTGDLLSRSRAIK